MLTADDLDDPYASFRDLLTEALMEEAVFEGFSQKTLHHVMKTKGFPLEQDVLFFPDGIVDAIIWHSLRADDLLQKRTDQNALHALKIRERIEWLIMSRFNHARYQREAIRRAFVILALPQNLKHNLYLLHHTVDTMWFLAGDTTTDFNYYTKRLILAGVYSATLPIWLHDSTDDLLETRSFLRRRIQNTLNLGKIPKIFPFVEKGLLSLGALAGRLRYKQ